MRPTGAAMALRTAHVAVAAIELAALGELWICALTNRRNKMLWAAVGVLAVEGVGLVIGRGDCPLGPLQERLGDRVPLFELVLPPRSAKDAVPTLAGATFLGVGVLVARSTNCRRVARTCRRREKDDPVAPGGFCSRGSTFARVLTDGRGRSSRGRPAGTTRRRPCP